jgi:hypothetical protein
LTRRTRGAFEDMLEQLMRHMMGTSSNGPQPLNTASQPTAAAASTAAAAPPAAAVAAILTADAATPTIVVAGTAVAAAAAKPIPLGIRKVQRLALVLDETILVNALLSLGGDPGVVLATIKNETVTRKDMTTLRHGEWLNDVVVNAFFSVLHERASKVTNMPSCCFLNSHFYTKLAESHSGYTYEFVLRWTKKRPSVFSYDLVIIPIHCSGNHWTLAVINFPQQRFEYHDSLRGREGMVLTYLRQWLQDESKDKLDKILDLSKWTDVCFQDEIPSQLNGFDCGVFMCKSAEYIGQGGFLDFKQADMRYMRQHIALELHNFSRLDDSATATASTPWVAGATASTGVPGGGGGQRGSEVHPGGGLQQDNVQDREKRPVKRQRWLEAGAEGGLMGMPE